MARRGGGLGLPLGPTFPDTGARRADNNNRDVLLATRDSYLLRLREGLRAWQYTAATGLSAWRQPGAVQDHLDFFRPNLTMGVRLEGDETVAW